MAELLEAHTATTKVVRRGETVVARVLSVAPGRIILDIGAKSEGVVSGLEYDAVREFAKTLRAGDEVTATVVTPETYDGTALLSLKTSGRSAGWKLLKIAQENQQPVKIVVKESKRSGLFGEVFGIPCFIPNSHLGKNTLQQGQAIIDRTLSVLVLEVDSDRERIVVSERAVSEKEEFAKQQSILASITPGERFLGEVTHIVPFGAFVGITKNGVHLEGLVHLSEISWEKVSDPSSVVAVGDKVDVVALGDPSSGRAGPPLARAGQLSFSIKRAQEDPWQGIAEKFGTDSEIAGTAVRAAERNFIVEVQPGIEGTLAKSKIPHGMVLQIGQKVECFVESVDESKRKLVLGLRLTTKPVGYK